MLKNKFQTNEQLHQSLLQQHPTFAIISAINIKYPKSEVSRCPVCIGKNIDEHFSEKKGIKKYSVYCNQCKKEIKEFTNN